MTSISLKNISKYFDDVKAVDSVSIEIKEGEVLTLLGPSGCGKSTTLRMIAGFYFPDTGQILFGDKDVSYLAPQKRGTAMVFQSYALWPHLSVRRNVEFGLTIKKVPKSKREQLVREVLKRVRLEEMIDRMPSQLSGGQQQRVAVARALVVNPEVLLLDEPLSNLDAKLRVQTRQEIRDLVKELNLTTIFVTHDQSEALSISDRIAVLDHGKLLQIGDPETIWNTPSSAFVGSFIGEANVLDMEVSSVDPEQIKLVFTSFSGEKVKILSHYFKGITDIGQSARVVIRPNSTLIHLNDPDRENIIPAKIKMVMFFGDYTFVNAKIADNVDVTLHVNIDFQVEKDQVVYIEVDPSEIRVFGKNYY